MAKIYKGAFSGILPITISGTGTGVLASYKIFGNGSGVGVETEASGYKLPILSNSVVTDIYIGNDPLAKDEYVDSATGKIYRRTKNLSPPEEEWTDEWIWGDGTVHPSTEIKVSPFIDVSTCETCIMEVFSAEIEWAAAGYREMAFYDENKQYLGWIGGGGRRTLRPNSSERLSEFPVGTVYVRISCSHGDQPFYPQLVSGYTPTHQFYPYLVPTDPPAPFPQIPTSASSTTIGWAGEALAPSQFDGVAGWGNLPVHQLKGVPYTGTLPAVLTGTKAGYLYKYGVYGNTVQDGTPTPENPIEPSGCGERTGNLFDAATAYGSMYDSATGVLVGAASTLTFIRNKFDSSMVGVPITISVHVDDVSVTRAYIRCAIGGTNIDSNAIASGRTGTMTVTVTPTSVNDDWRITFGTGTGNLTLSNIMLNTGSTAIPYEPYGYKLPIAVNGVEYPIYLGEAETTREIKKLVLTGEEDWSRQSVSHTTCINLYTAITSAEPSGMIISNAATYNSNAGLSNDSLVNVGRINNIGTNLLMDMELSKFATASAWKTYLREQYANGTPVTVWYVLAEPETGMVNGPLMKIGDYADTIDSTQTTVQIPTAAGSTTISWAGEGLAPSQFDSIQEWVDIPTYTYTSGAWVADS